MTDEQLHDRIEKYLLGELTPEENARLETEIAADPALREQVEIQRLALEGIKMLAAEDLRKKFAQWEKEMASGSKKPASPSFLPSRLKILTWISFLLFFILLAVAFRFFQQQRNFRETEKQRKQEIQRRDSIISALENDIQLKQNELSSLLSDTGNIKDSSLLREIILLKKELELMKKKSRELGKHKPLPDEKIVMLIAISADREFRTRGEEEVENQTLREAQAAYDSENYSEAARILKKIPENDGDLYLQGLHLLPYALFYEKNYEEAVKSFNELKKKDIFEANKAEWFISLCYFAEGKNDLAVKSLDNILKNKDHTFFNEAKSLKKILRE